MKKQREKMKSFQHIGDILQETLVAYGRSGEAALTQIWRLWDDAVGPVIAENTRPAAFKGSLLIVHTQSSVWVQQLQFNKAEIIQKANEALGKPLISDIRFKVGDIGGSS